MTSIVAIDIETTGLDPNSDSIIEIGAVRFSGSRVEQEWSTLVNPNKPIPSFISQLTGISNEMVRKAPPIKSVIQDLADFIGADPVVGHNIRFDLSFLQRQNILKLNEVIDTYELAAVLMPTASRYNLGALGQSMGIPLAANHRALDDARVTHAVFIKLYEAASSLPLEMLAEFVRLSEPFDWGAGWAFSRILRARSREPMQAKRVKTSPPDPLFDDRQPPPQALYGTIENPTPLDPEEVASLLEYGGPFSHYSEKYEYRQQQIEMLRAVCTSLSTKQHLMVEAGTGTGKSFAYLIPAALWASQNNVRVVISTNTINLQDQLINKDIPDLNSILQLDLRAAILKGKSNYLCPRHLEMLRQRGPENVDQMRVLAKILVWQMNSTSGDRNEINLNGPTERDIWVRVSADNENCRPENCAIKSNGMCPFYRSRQAAQMAHLLIVNHALLLSDISTGSRVLPEYDYLIIDEAHHLEAATTNALSFRVTLSDLLRLLRELGGTSTGILGRELTILQTLLRPSDFAVFRQTTERITDLAFRLEFGFQNFFLSANRFLDDQRNGQSVGSYGQQERIIPATRTQPAWTEVEIAWDEVHETHSLMLNLIAQLYKSVAELEDNIPEELEETQSNLSTVYRRLFEANDQIHSFVAQPNQEMIYWMEIPPNNGQLVLQAAPLNIGPLMEKFLWHEKSCVILTSATLTTSSGFDYLRNRLSADEANELELGSPFDYETAAMLYVVNDIPEPNDANNYQRGVEQTIIRLSRATQGRMLVLFTSYAQLKRTSQVITPVLADNEIIVFEQGEGASPNTLLETFRETDKAILLGTRSFWEGVDIPGQALSVLVIVKLPFDVPSDPIVAARSETFEDPFNEYHLPEAILRFRQGFGRLIRTQSDRGIVAVLDRRIITKRYGRSFIESLPGCQVKSGPMMDLPQTAVKWLNL